MIDAAHFFLLFIPTRYFASFLQVWFAPTRHQPLDVDIEHAGQYVRLIVLDTAGLEDYDEQERLRDLASSNVVLLCFSFDSPDSLLNVQDKVRDASHRGKA
jgi:hypothetical protein